MVLERELGAAVLDKHVELFKRALVQKLGDTLAGCVFSFLVLSFYSFFTAAKLGIGPALNQFLYVVLLNGHIK